MIAQQHPARDQPGKTGDQPAEQHGADRLAPSKMRRQHAGRIGARAEISGMPERDDAGIAEDQVEGQREDDRNEDLGAERQIVRKDEERHDRQDPRQALRPMPALPVAHEGAGRENAVGDVAARRHALPNSPSGFASRIAMATT